MKKPVRRCALYTRKSSEEGLEQDFNSLEAQREACAAYVKSQASEGWRALDARYDDGGFSGGSMERPALQRLLADIAAGKIDVVVVYKIDRLTRALMDFARMVELFDRHDVSFVSVTQAFNTTSSMGRLTLNVLLSFAQFEREVTGERIRDKIAASKAKGMWMGGNLPLGYDLPEAGRRALVLNKGEAEIVRTIFAMYLELGSVRALEHWLALQDIRSKRRTTAGGRTVGGQPFNRGALFHMLRNRTYLGVIVHRDKVHPGMHPAIVDAGPLRGRAAPARRQCPAPGHAPGTLRASTSYRPHLRCRWPADVPDLRLRPEQEALPLLCLRAAARPAQPRPGHDHPAHPGAGAGGEARRDRPPRGAIRMHRSAGSADPGRDLS